MPNRSWRTLQAAAILAAGATLLLTVVIVGAMTPGFSQSRDAVSRLGSPGEAHAALARAGIALSGLLTIVGATALGTRVPDRQRLVGWCIAGYGVAAVVAGLCPKDEPRAPHTVMSRVHVDATLVGGALMLVAMAVVARDAPEPRLRRVTATLALFVVALIVVFPFTWGSSVYGLVERLMLGLAIVWLDVLALRVADTTRQPSLVSSA